MFQGLDLYRATRIYIYYTDNVYPSRILSKIELGEQTFVVCFLVHNVPIQIINNDIFGYQAPYKGYNDVLADYANWLKSLTLECVEVIDFNGPMLDYTLKQRADNPNFAFSTDGVHPQFAGHVMMAQQIMRHTGIPFENMDVQDAAQRYESDELYKLVHNRRHMRSMAWLVSIGFEMPGDYKALPKAEAEKKAAEMKAEILARLKESK